MVSRDLSLLLLPLLPLPHVTSPVCGVVACVARASDRYRGDGFEARSHVTAIAL